MRGAIGKARGLGVRLPEADVCIDISWYRHLAEADPYALCGVMRSRPVCCTMGKSGRVTLLLKHPDKPVQEANLWGITISSHIFKLEATALYALATAICEPLGARPSLEVCGGGVPPGGSPNGAHEARPSQASAPMVDMPVTDLAKFFDVTAHDINPIVGARVGLGDASHLATNLEGFLYA